MINYRFVVKVETDAELKKTSIFVLLFRTVDCQILTFYNILLGLKLLLCDYICISNVNVEMV